MRPLPVKKTCHSRVFSLLGYVAPHQVSRGWKKWGERMQRDAINGLAAFVGETILHSMGFEQETIALISVFVIIF